MVSKKDMTSCLNSHDTDFFQWVTKISIPLVFQELTLFKNNKTKIKKKERNCL